MGPRSRCALLGTSEELRRAVDRNRLGLRPFDFERFPGLEHLARLCLDGLDVHDFDRSGIVLADRRLTVSDIMVLLTLRRAALVYLNSCDSAHPVPGRWDELMALLRAFLEWSAARLETPLS